MTSAQDVLNVARGELGYTEGPRSNETKYGAWSGYNFQPWCDSWTSWVFDRAGLPFPGKFAYCPTHVNWFKSIGRWHTRPEVGDVVFYGTGGFAVHVGIVEAVGRDSITVIEGNTSTSNNVNGGMVMRRQRLLGNWIVGFGRPAYSAAPPPYTETPIEGDIDMAFTVAFSVKLGADGKGYTDIDIPTAKLIGAPVLNASDPGPGGQGYPPAVSLSRLALGNVTRVVAVGGQAGTTIGVAVTRV